MHKIIHDLKCKISKDNPIFGDNAFYFKDYAEFVNRGVSDKICNLFYIRPLNLNPNKISIIGKNAFNLLIERSKHRAVFQLSGIDKMKAMEILRNQLLLNDCLVITNYSDDSSGIYKAEYGKEKDMKNMFLLSFDFDVVNEFIPTDCGCLTLEMC